MSDVPWPYLTENISDKFSLPESSRGSLQETFILAGKSYCVSCRFPLNQSLVSQWSRRKTPCFFWRFSALMFDDSIPVFRYIYCLNQVVPGKLCFSPSWTHRCQFCNWFSLIYRGFYHSSQARGKWYGMPHQHLYFPTRRLLLVEPPCSTVKSVQSQWSTI